MSERRLLRFTLGELHGPENSIALQADLLLTIQAGRWVVEADGVQGKGPTLHSAVLAWLAVRLGSEPPHAGEGAA